MFGTAHGCLSVDHSRLPASFLFVTLTMSVIESMSASICGSRWSSIYDWWWVVTQDCACAAIWTWNILKYDILECIIHDWHRLHPLWSWSYPNRLQVISTDRIHLVIGAYSHTNICLLQGKNVLEFVKCRPKLQQKLSPLPLFTNDICYYSYYSLSTSFRKGWFGALHGVHDLHKPSV